MLTVRVYPPAEVIPVRERIPVAGRDASAQASILFELFDERASGLSDLRCSICRAVVDDKDVGAAQFLGEFIEDGRQIVLLIPRGDEYECAWRRFE
jgi:hypothetical protein